MFALLVRLSADIGLAFRDALGPGTSETHRSVSRETDTRGPQPRQLRQQDLKLNAIVDRFRIPLSVVLWLFYNACQQLLYCRLICSVSRHFKAVQLRGAIGVKVAKILVVINNICHFLQKANSFTSRNQDIL